MNWRVNKLLRFVSRYTLNCIVYTTAHRNAFPEKMLTRNAVAKRGSLPHEPHKKLLFMAQHLSLFLSTHVKRRQNTAMHYFFCRKPFNNFMRFQLSLLSGSDRQVAAFAKKNPEKILVFLYLLEDNKVLSH